MKVKLESIFILPEVAPFYLVLSMWVGAIITCVMLRTGQSTGTKYTPSEMYFGKLLIFLVMAILETTVTLIGAFILGIKMANPLLFVLSAYFIALIFMLICYSLISAISCNLACIPNFRYWGYLSYSIDGTIPSSSQPIYANDPWNHFAKGNRIRIGLV